jgi:hypothetical protein
MMVVVGALRHELEQVDVLLELPQLVIRDRRPLAELVQDRLDTPLDVAHVSDLRARWDVWRVWHGSSPIGNNGDSHLGLMAVGKDGALALAVVNDVRLRLTSCEASSGEGLVARNRRVTVRPM